MRPTKKKSGKVSANKSAKFGQEFTQEEEEEEEAAGGKLILQTGESEEEGKER